MTILALRTVSLANRREHWAVRAKRAKNERKTAYYGVSAHVLPCVVTMTRMAPRSLDDDNLRGAMKSVRDGIADRLGIDDRDKRVRWEYGQMKNGSNYGVVVTIE